MFKLPRRDKLKEFIAENGPCSPMLREDIRRDNGCQEEPPMNKFQCQMVDYDDPEEWHEVEAFGPDDAAQEYAELCDSRSAGELFQDNVRDKQVVLVRHRAAEPMRFEISFDYSKYFYAHENHG